MENKSQGESGENEVSEEISEEDLDLVVGGSGKQSNRKGSATDDSSLESKKLQSIADRRAKLNQTLGNVLVKIQETQNSIISNLK